jgi:hypothetical protein
VAFTEAERETLGLTGRLPSVVLTLKQLLHDLLYLGNWHARPAHPGQLPGQVPDLQRRHAGHRRRRHGRAVQRAEGHQHPLARTSASWCSAAAPQGATVMDGVFGDD